MFNSNFFHSEKGSALFFAIVALALLLGVGVGLTTLFLGGSRIAGGRESSLPAFYAAETGIERTLRVDWCLFTYGDSSAESDRLDCLAAVVGVAGASYFSNIPLGHCAPSTPCAPPANRWRCKENPASYDETWCRQNAVWGLEDTSLPNGATYAAEIVTAGCSAGIFCAESTGTFQGVSRKIEVER